MPIHKTICFQSIGGERNDEHEWIYSFFDKKIEIYIEFYFYGFDRIWVMVTVFQRRYTFERRYKESFIQRANILKFHGENK